jgi:hypothetical protein
VRVGAGVAGLSQLDGGGDCGGNTRADADAGVGGGAFHPDPDAGGEINGGIAVPADACIPGGNL